jgi:hypothetical protein
MRANVIRIPKLNQIKHSPLCSAANQHEDKLQLDNLDFNGYRVESIADQVVKLYLLVLEFHMTP